MRHLKAGSKLKRDSGSRKALLRNLVTSVIEQERVVTTVTKAKAVKPLIDKMITLGKRDTLHARRQAASFLETPTSVKKLFDTLGARFGQRQGGEDILDRQPISSEESKRAFCKIGSGYRCHFARSRCGQRE